MFINQRQAGRTRPTRLKPKLAGFLLLGLIPLGFLAQGWADSSTVQASDVLLKPAMQSPLAQKSLINGLTHAGARVIAVGQRGHILLSDDQGKTWSQALVPVSSDLVAVHFPDAQVGYAVGHDGVVLKSIDGGEQWVLVLDGRHNNDVENPYLDVWFDTAEEGYVVGAFGKILYTADGGKSWVNKMDAVDNPNSMHIYSIKRLGGELYLAGEQGLFNHLNTRNQRFEKQDLPYKGSLFGIAGNQDSIWAYGLRGNLFRSNDQGKNWQQVPTGVSGALTASTIGPQGEVSIVSLSGQLIRIESHHESTDKSGSNGEPDYTLSTLRLSQPAAAVLATVDGFVVGGLRGLGVTSSASGTSSTTSLEPTK